METLDRTDLDYWKLGLSKVLKAAGSAAPPPKITKVEAQKVITKMVDEGKSKPPPSDDSNRPSLVLTR